MNPGEKERTVTKYSKQEVQTSNICGKIPYETRTNNLSRSISCETYAMNRGHEGTDIFYGNKNKSQFLDYLADATTKMKIKIFAYCVMDTHYHLVLENSNGKMSEFMKRLNGQYGSYYRMVSGGKGYVFQDRFKSTLIEKDAYLLQSIAYLLRNPLRAGIVRNVEDYIWSSIKTYYSDNTDSTNDIVDAEFVNDLFGTREELMGAIETIGIREPPVILTKYGEVLGSDEFLKAVGRKGAGQECPCPCKKGPGTTWWLA